MVRRTKFVAALLAAGLFAGPRARAADEPAPLVHSVCDISHEFTFYMDGRFHRQYLEGHGRDARNWGTLAELDLSNTNLLVLVGGDPRLPYEPAAVDLVAGFVADGGTVLLMADGGDPMPPGAVIAERFGATLTTVAARGPLRGVGEAAEAEIAFRRGTTLQFDSAAAWTPLVVDAEGRPVLAAARHGQGHVILGSRGLFGQQPDASDPINAAWVTPLLLSRAASKPVDPDRPHRSTSAELRRQVGPLTLEYHRGTEPFADAVHGVYEEVRPHLREITGVDPAPGMISSMLILPTGGGGFSSGARIAIGAWWGGFPERRYPMVELIAHEATHSWVLPHAEPLWNEPIATYLGIMVGRRMGLPEAEETLRRQIERARRHDPDLTAVDPQAAGAPRDLIWGKSYFVFEELERLHGPGSMAKYFVAKRTLVPAGRRTYTMDDCVAVWSRAVGEDLFPWFVSLGFDVSAARTDLAG
ncbi:MAG: hypothetical protein ACYTEV_11055 [Planctomycetota bacterium]|jgi:hypothetical protein